MKRCSVCHETKDNIEFHKRTRAKDGLQSHCKECNKAQRKEYYKTAHGRDKNVVAGKRWKVQQRKRVYDYLLEHPCDCGESDPIVLEFDHRNPDEKILCVCEMVIRGYAWSKISAEIAKCDVRCANCHKRRTAEQFGWYAWSLPD